MQDLYVDLPGLSRVHRTLQRIRYDLIDFDRSDARANTDALGHHRVINAFEDFVHGWTDGRERIDGQLEVAIAKIEAAVEAYNQAEERISTTADDMKGGLQ